MIVNFSLDLCPHCGDFVGEVEMQVHFDEDNYPMSIEALESAGCSCGRNKVEKGAEYQIIQHFGEYPDIVIEAIGGEL